MPNGDRSQCVKREVETENFVADFQRSGAVQRIAAVSRQDHHQDPDAAAS